jgi:hypothetical protein
VLPTDKNRPKYFHIRGFFWLVVLIAVVNTTYIAFPVFVLWGGPWGHPMIFALVVFLIQFAMYWMFCWIRQRKEVTA